MIYAVSLLLTAVATLFQQPCEAGCINSAKLLTCFVVHVDRLGCSCGTALLGRNKFYKVFPLLLEGSYLKLEDACRRFRNPSILDIKIGRVSYDPDADEHKRSIEMAKYPPLSELGFQLLGMRVGAFSENWVQDGSTKAASISVGSCAAPTPCVRHEFHVQRLLKRSGCGFRWISNLLNALRTPFNGVVLP